MSFRSRPPRLASAPRALLRRLPAPPPWPQLRRRLIVVALVLVALATAYFVWFRNSSFVAVERVQVTGIGVDPKVEAELSQVAHGMSTLHVDRAALEGAVADEPSVLGMKVEPDFPHGLKIDVQSRRPAAYIEASGGVVVAGDGVVLAEGVQRPDGLPVIDVPSPRLEGRASGAALNAARILGAVPKPLSAQVSSGGVDPEHGPVVELNGGIELRFGDPSRAAEKWRAAAAVLADPELTTAEYIDLSAPSRPVVG